MRGLSSCEDTDASEEKENFKLCPVDAVSMVCHWPA